MRTDRHAIRRPCRGRSLLAVGVTLAAASLATAVPAAAAGLTPQTVTVDAPAGLEYGQSAYVPATATSGLPVALTTSTPDVCTFSGTVVLAVGVGTCTITASQAGDDTYAAADPVTRDVPVSRSTPTIAFYPPPDLDVGGSAQLVYYSGSRYVIGPDSSPAVTVASLSPAVCTVADAGGLDPVNLTDPNLTVTAVAPGTCTLQATQEGNAYFTAAEPVTRTLSVAHLPQAVSFTLAAVTVDAGTALTATSGSGLPVAFTSLTPAVCTVSGTTVVGVAVGLCTVAAAQAGDATYAPAEVVTSSTTVQGLPQTLTLSGSPTLAYGASALLTATSDAGLPVDVTTLTPATCAVSGAADTGWVVTGGDPGACTLRAAQSGDSRHAAATPQTYGITIVRAEQVVAVTAPASLQAADSNPVPVTATSGGGVLVTTTTPDVCAVQSDAVPGWPATVVGVSAGTCTLVAAQAGTTRYAPATTSVSFRVTRMSQTITAWPVGDVAYGSSATGGVNASSGQAVTVTSTTPDVCTVATTPGWYTVTATGVGSCGLHATQAGDGRYGPATADLTLSTVRAGQAIRFPQPAPIAVGLSSTLEVGATSGLPVAVATTTPAVCAVTAPATVTALAAGTCTVVASQPGDARWTAAPDVVHDIHLGVAPQAITFPAPPTSVIGARQTLAARADSGLPVSYATATPAVCTVDHDPAGWSVVGTASGTCSVTATQPGDDVYLPAAAVTASYAVTPMPQAITFVPPAAATAGTTVTLAGWATSGLPVAYTSSTAAVCTVSGSTLALTGAGACTVTARQYGDGRYNPAPEVTATVTVTAGNRVPTVSAANVTQAAGTAFGVTPTVTDADGDPVTLSVWTGGRLSTSVSDGRITLSAPTSASGRVTVTVTARDSHGAIARTTFTDIVRPRAVSSATVRTRSGGFTVTWPAAATTNASYAVAVGATRVCITTRTACAVPWHYRTTMRITVTVLGRDRTQSTPRTAARG